MSDDILHQILLKLGSIEEGQLRLRESFIEEKKYTKESRDAVTSQLSTVNAQMNRAHSDIEILGQAVGQTRDSVNEKMDALTKRIDEDIQPTVDEYKKIRLMGSGILWAAGLAGGSLATAAIFWWETVLNAVRGFLR